MPIPREGEFLTTLITGKLLSGQLRGDVPEKVVGGRGNGAPCAICDRPLRQMQLEAIFLDGQTAHAHLTCFAEWRRLAGAGPSTNGR